MTAGAGISITTGAGSITVAKTSIGGSGLYRQVMSPTPTSASTGLATWLNQGTSVVTDSATGLNLTAPPSATAKSQRPLHGRADGALYDHRPAGSDTRQWQWQHGRHRLV